MTKKEAYDILQAKEGDDINKIKKNYHKLLKLFHSDNYTDAEEKNDADEQTKRINDAWQAIKNNEFDSEPNYAQNEEASDGSRTKSVDICIQKYFPYVESKVSNLCISRNVGDLKRVMIEATDILRAVLDDIYNDNNLSKFDGNFVLAINDLNLSGNSKEILKAIASFPDKIIIQQNLEPKYVVPLILAFIANEPLCEALYNIAINTARGGSNANYSYNRTYDTNTSNSGSNSSSAYDSSPLCNYFPEIATMVNDFYKRMAANDYRIAGENLRLILEAILKHLLGEDFASDNEKGFIQSGIDALDISDEHKGILHRVRKLGNQCHHGENPNPSEVSALGELFLHNEDLADDLLTHESQSLGNIIGFKGFTLLQKIAFVAQILIFLGLMRTRWSIPLLIEDSYAFLLVMPLIFLKYLFVIILFIVIAFINWVFPGFADIVTNTLDNYSSPGLLIFNIILGALIIFYITKHYIFAFYKGLKERVYTTALIGLAGLFFSTLGIINMIGTENGFIPSTHNNKNIKNEYCTVLDDTSLIKKPVDKVENIKEDVEVYKGTNLLMTGRYAKVEDVTYVEVYLDSEKKEKTEWIDSRYLNIWQEFAK